MPPNVMNLDRYGHNVIGSSGFDEGGGPKNTQHDLINEINTKRPARVYVRNPQALYNNRLVEATRVNRYEHPVREYT